MNEVANAEGAVGIAIIRQDNIKVRFLIYQELSTAVDKSFV
jgi:hypothetical protein